MILYTESSYGHRQSWRIHSYADFEPLMELYPSVQFILEDSDNLRDAAEKVSNYIASHQGDSWVEQDEFFNKSIKGAITGLTMATAAMSPIAVSPIQNSVPLVNRVPVQTQQISPLGKQPEDKFLNNIMQLETSGGTNWQHPTIEHGVDKGQRAIGRWGLLKPTVDEVIGRMEQSKKAIPAVSRLKGMTRDGMEAYFKQYPKAELDVARYLARHVLHNQNHDMRRSAYAWLYGHNLRPADITEQDLDNEKYVKEFMKLSQGQHPEGLKGTKIPIVKKNETPNSFKERLKTWRKARDLQSIKENDMFPERNRGIDPGRKIDPSEEIDLRTKTGNPIKDIQNSIDDAKRSRIKSVSG